MPVILSAAKDLCVRRAPSLRSGWQPGHRSRPLTGSLLSKRLGCQGRGKPHYISKKRPSRCVILSAAQDLVWVTNLVTPPVYVHRRPASEPWCRFQRERQFLPLATM